MLKCRWSDGVLPICQLFLLCSHPYIEKYIFWHPRWGQSEAIWMETSSFASQRMQHVPPADLTLTSEIVMAGPVQTSDRTLLDLSDEEHHIDCPVSPTDHSKLGNSTREKCQQPWSLHLGLKKKDWIPWWWGVGAGHLGDMNFLTNCAIMVKKSHVLLDSESQ